MGPGRPQRLTMAELERLLCAANPVTQDLLDRIGLEAVEEALLADLKGRLALPGGEPVGRYRVSERDSRFDGCGP